MSMKSIGVVGAGVMGTGLAHILAETGHRVILVDVDEAKLGAARRAIQKNLRMYRMLVARSSGTAAVAPTTSVNSSDGETLARIEGTTDPLSLRAADFIIENITEKWELKQEIHGRIDKLDMPPVPIAINTSAIPIARFAALYAQPQRVVGMHFMNPVPLMPMVEVIRGKETGEPTLGSAKRIVEQMGRQCIVVNDSPGFVTNRVMMLTVNEAIFLLAEGVSSPEDIDRLFHSCFNHRMGPLATADLIGLDTVLYSIEVLQREFGDDKYRPCALLQDMVKRGLLGRKSGKGFFDYDLA